MRPLTYACMVFGLLVLGGAGFLAGCGDDDDFVRVGGLVLNKTSLELAVGHTEVLRTTVTPFNASYKELSWESSNPKVAKVDFRGRVFALSAGTAVISAVSKDGGKIATCALTVKKDNSALCKRQDAVMLKAFEDYCKTQKGCPFCDCINQGKFPNMDNNEEVVVLGCYIPDEPETCEGEDLTFAENCLDDEAQCRTCMFAFGKFACKEISREAFWQAWGTCF